MFEAHGFSALLPTLERAVLIRHQLQLRPQIVNHDFSMENLRGGDLYTSLFERVAERRKALSRRVSGLSEPNASVDRRPSPEYSLP